VRGSRTTPDVTSVLDILMRKVTEGDDVWPCIHHRQPRPSRLSARPEIDGRNDTTAAGANETYVDDEVDRMTRVRSEIVPTVKWATLGDQYENRSMPDSSNTS